ncbi:hypothetical protein [Staphylococcus aureus]|uniref:hypothetical protein n=1 Tax=Staphylococcus aureus TaxID=1280 RepID=UPI0012A3899C|nr:hypothetical protein [Staphylococcus aureus]AYD82577.1 hypothetical protein ART_00108 [Achromobacter phage vB_Ade_ART]MBD4207877.1 hypothetical protein [Xanthomonas citri pv. citri]
MTGEILDVAKGMPWYATLAGALLGAVLLGGYVKRFLSKEGVNTADDKATVASIAIYKSLVDELKEQLKIEREGRVLAEGKHDELLKTYANLTGEVAALRLTVQHQTDQITEQNQELARQAKTIDQLRDQVQILTKGYHAPVQD